MSEPTLDLHASLDGYALAFVTRDQRGAPKTHEVVALFPTLADAVAALRAARDATLSLA
jgi:hypothetical protein